jgi:zinc-binding in reverse transcriptase
MQKVRLFIWKYCQGAILTMGTLPSRITIIKPTCQRCNSENEYLNHMLFFYDRSRAIWFASPLALKVDELPLTFTETLLNLTTIIQSKDHQLLSNITWCIWKVRNEHTFEGRNINPVKVLQLAQRMTHIK